MGFSGPRRRWAIRRLVEATGNVCRYCGVELADEPDGSARERDVPPHTRTVDHVVPRALGGSHRIDNLALACRRCNHAKSDLPLVAFVDRLRASGA